MVEWMGTEATLDAIPGGDYRVLCGGVNPSAGEFREVVANERVVFTGDILFNEGGEGVHAMGFERHPEFKGLEVACKF